MVFEVVSLFILILFYGIYFIKIYVQRRRGIRTRQLGTCKDKAIRRVEAWMSVATFIIIPVQVVSIFLDLHLPNDTVRFVGILSGVVGDAVFLIAVVTMKNSWRVGIPDKDRTTLVSTGIYRISRNPAFLGFDLMYIGICFIYCNILTVMFTLFAMVMLHLQILQEEKFLEKAFGDEYMDYKKKVFRYFGWKLAI